MTLCACRNCCVTKHICYPAGVSNHAVANSRISDAALEMGKLIVELINTGYGRRRDPTATASSGPISAHGIRAAIHLYQYGELSVSELAAGLGVSRGWASRIVEELERAGYIERRRSIEDRRVVRVSLSPASMVDIEREYRWRGDAVDAALEPLDPREREAVRRFLTTLVGEMRQAAAPASRPEP